MSHQQMVQIVLDAYSSMPEFKEYFEFFLNPDVDKLLAKHDEIVKRELSRTKWGYSKAKTTVLKKAVKKFIGFNPGPEAVLNMLFLTLERLGAAERYLNFKEPLMNYCSYLSAQILSYADENQLAAEAISRLGEMAKSPQYTSYFKKYIRQAE